MGCISAEGMKHAGLIAGFVLAFASVGCGSDTGSAGPDATQNADSGNTPVDAASVDAANNPSIDAADTGGTLTFLTYNVHGLPAIITGDDTTARTTAIAPLLNAFDVVGLQEDFLAENHAILENASTHSVKAWFSEIETTQIYGSGAAVFANLVEVERYTEYYTACNGTFDAGSDCLSSKGFLMLRLELTPGVEIDIYDTHLDAGGGSADDDARTVQVNQLIASMTTRSAGRAIVFMADTNLEASDPNEGPTLARFLSEAGLTDACAAVSCAEDDHIDRILFRASATVALTAETWTNEPGFFDGSGTPLSDHPAISVRFRWAPR